MAEHDLVERVHGIDGLSLLRDAAGPEAAQRILENLRGEVHARWRHWRPFSRQDFGFEYDISSRGANPTTPIPPEIRALFPALRAAGWKGDDPTQVIVTRYPRGGSLGAHVDSPVFGPEVAGISLGAEWPIHFSRGRRGRQENIPLPVLSAYVMRGSARQDWFHQVPPCFDGERISLTFRTMAPEAPAGDPQSPAERMRRQLRKRNGRQGRLYR